MPLGAFSLEEIDCTHTVDAVGLHLAQRGMGDIIDGTTGRILKGELVAKARQVEMEYFVGK